MPDPVAWKAVEKGWAVYDRDGEEIGKVEEIAGDEEADIFDGFGIKTGTFGSTKYVPAEIVEGEVRLNVTADRLQDFAEPAAEERIVPEGSTWYQRLAWWLTGRNR